MFKRTPCAVVLCTLLLSTSMHAADISVFVGDWTEDVSRMPATNPITFEVNGSTVRMTSPSHKPSEWVLDALKNPQPTDPESLSSTTRNQHGGFNRRYEVDGKVINEESWDLSSDENTLFYSSTHYAPYGPHTLKRTYRRTSGSRGLTGTWQPITNPPATLRITEQSGVLTVSRSNGHEVVADGKPRRISESPAALFQELVATAEDGIIQTQGLKNGEVTLRGRLRASPDAKTLTEIVEFTDASGKPIRWTTVFRKQP